MLEGLRIRTGRKLEDIERASANFHRMAKIPKIDVKDKAIFESGHQPNFLPYPGVWRKVFLLSHLAKAYDANPIFGFHDLNVCTSKWLFQNRIPAMNKNGFVTVGFKRKRRNMSLNAMDKPSEDEWNEVIGEIEKRYGGSIVIDELQRSYDLATNFADVNAIFFARLSFRMGFDNVLFFRYSDILSAFKEEWNKIILKLDRRMYWYRCRCGGMTMDEVCPICGGNDFIYPVPNAILRHLLFFEGLRTSVFVSGSGGLSYGKIADEIASKLGLNRPITICWIGRDLYMNDVRRKVVEDLKRLLGVKDLKDMEKGREALRGEDKGAMGRYRYAQTLMEIARRSFELKPSMIDLIYNVGLDGIVTAWIEAFERLEFERDGRFLLLKGDIDYDGSAKVFEEMIGCSREC